MEELVQTYIGKLPRYLALRSDVVTELVIHEIERALPKIISELEMPQPLDTGTRRQIEGCLIRWD
jgi:hypothetical protein